MKTSNSVKNLFCSLFFLSAATVTHAQIQNWSAIEVQGEPTSKLTFKAGYLKAFDLSNKFSSVFQQVSFQGNYEINKKWDVQSGVQFITPASSSKTRTRVFVRTAYTTRIAKKINWTNSLRIETNSKAENRFRQRIILTTRLGLRKRLKFLNLAPSVSYSLFYNIGGDSLNYYDANEVLIARQTPDGLHRSRLTIAFNSKVNKYLRVNMYYMLQQEFNLLVPDIRKMNIYDPVRKKTVRSFNNYNTIGVTAQIMLTPFFKK